jgi:hypothetical protein
MRNSITPLKNDRALNRTVIIILTTLSHQKYLQLEKWSQLSSRSNKGDKETP